MKELPILYSTEMVQAIMEGRKEKTRRIITQQPDDNGLWNHSKFPMSLDSKLKGWHGTVEVTGEDRRYNCPYGTTGDLLYVRETFFDGYQYINGRPSEEEATWYLADSPSDSRPGGVSDEWCINEFGLANKDTWPKWKPSIHMPKSAARIWLKVTDVRVERLGSLTTEQALQEGFVPGDRESPSDAYKNYWCKSIGEEAWKQRPWVWVISFDVLSTAGKPKETRGEVIDRLFNLSQ